jgi:TonB family protein
MSKLATIVLGSMGLWAPAFALAGEEPPVHGDGRAEPYLQALHTRVHRIWADSFLVMAEGQLPKDHPINLPSRAAQLEVVLTSEGKLADVKVAKPSGSDDFDGSAVDVVKASAPFVVAPEEVLSDDGKVHLRWTLARDDRRCSGASIDIKTGRLDEAVAMLVAQGRESVALARLKAADDPGERQAAFTKFARAWLDRAEDDKELAIRVAVANATAGDDRGAERLRKAVAKNEEVELAAHGLTLLKTGLCALVKAPDGECLPDAIAVAKNRQAPTAERIVAIEALGTRDEPDARNALKALFKDSAGAVRASAILAEARAGAGKGAVFRLTALLRDPSLEVRAAAGAALVRVGGEEALTQLFLLFKEKDVRPYQAVARELGTLSGDASAHMLARFLRRDDRRIQLAGARALARRHDDAATEAQAGLTGATDPELRFLAAPAITDAEQRKAAVEAPEGYAWKDSCMALAQGHGKPVAIDWILAQFPKLAPETRVDLMGVWLASTRAKN